MRSYRSQLDSRPFGSGDDIAPCAGDQQGNPRGPQHEFKFPIFQGVKQILFHLAIHGYLNRDFAESIASPMAVQASSMPDFRSSQALSPEC